ncbi:MAG: hypothetical protein CVV64_11705 [Candidatus Wallbacteria bacterium HGW-Wallbacteria-1]|jgi:pimeloyl-ACP methyl ester carboxylesterase|uniref:AB hydrolase-1 domain-containing protein n=1 Tax=Candidatus Wallbacteria bacterium HGW-Wallbacteria-1 TaxID=2013854 RepID=A0A2N1PNR3_9BACT|nr:MAG: hypothetical protein CVV64_11705 [Candidatus Wallbacteria bacterium HGW-Wallbacteria-1]
MPFLIFRNSRYHYLDTLAKTPENKPALLLLPGNSTSSAVYQDEIDYFGKNFRVLCPDYCGYGKSHRLQELPVDFWMHNASVCGALADSLNLKSLIVIGTSGGGLIGLCLSIIRPDLVKALVADSIPGDMIPPEVAQSVVNGRQPRTRFQKRLWSRAHGDDWEDVVDADSRLLLRASLLKCGPYHGRIPEIVCPVLFTGSLNDDLIPQIGPRICEVASRIRKSRVALYPSGWHPFMWSMAATFRKEADRFISDCLANQTESRPT